MPLSLSGKTEKYFSTTHSVKKEDQFMCQYYLLLTAVASFFNKISGYIIIGFVILKAESDHSEKVSSGKNFNVLKLSLC